MAPTEDITHQAISSYFIGLGAENLDEFRNDISVILDEIQRAREKYFKEDVVRTAMTSSAFAETDNYRKTGIHSYHPRSSNPMSSNTSRPRWPRQCSRLRASLESIPFPSGAPDTKATCAQISLSPVCWDTL